MVKPKKRINKNGTISWKIEVCVKGQRAAGSFDTHLDAVIWADRQEKIFRGEIKPGPGTVGSGDMLFSLAADRFIIESRTIVAPSQISSYENSLLQLERSFGKKVLMSEITPQDVSSHILKRMTVDDVGPASIRNELSFIRSVYRKAKEWGINFPSPELEIKRPRAKMRSREERLDNIIKPAEIEAIFAEAQKRPNNLYLYLKFLLYSGMRPSEAAMLLWKRRAVSEEKRATKAFQHIGYVDLERGGFSKVGTKTADKRFVPAHPIAQQIIEELRATSPDDKQLVFLDDKYLDQQNGYKYYRRTFRTTTAHALINGDALRSDIDFYSFRHTFRTRLEECGVSTAIAETIIGHNDKSFKFTYIHMSDEKLIETIKLLRYDL